MFKKLLIIILPPDIVVFRKRDGYLIFLLQQGTLRNNGLQSFVAHQIIVEGDVASLFKYNWISFALQA